jgi:hypothetical protein
MVDEVRSRVDRAENADAGNLAKQFQRQPGAILEGDEIRTFDQTEGKMSDQDKQCCLLQRYSDSFVRTKH